jgi:short chain dehydrogenase
MAALRRMLRRDRGTIVQVGSALAYRAIPLQAPYCAAKFAIRGFTDSIRTELLHDKSHVHITMVQLPAVNTPQFNWCKTRLPNHPQPVPPIYQPEPFADAVLHCCEHPVRELPIGWGAQKLMWGQKLSPRAGDLMLLRMGWKSQHTDEDKPLDAPDNLFRTLPGDPGAHGRFDAQSRVSTLWTSLRLRRWLVGAAVVGAAALAGSTERGRKTGLLR